MPKPDREPTRAERAAAVRHGQATTERNRRILITLVIVLVLSAVVAGVVLFTGGGSDTRTAPSGDLPPASAQGQALVVGDNEEAKHTVVIYEDFLCPYCRELETSTRDFLHEAAADGRAQVEYRPFQLLDDDYSAEALSAFAAVLQEGTPEQALRFHDILFDRQPYESSPSKPDADTLVGWAKDAGVTDEAVRDAVRTPDPDFIAAANKTAQEAGVTGTPTVTVNGKPLEGSSVSELADNLESMLAQG